MGFQTLHLSNIPLFQHSILIMSASRTAWIAGPIGLLILLCINGCATPSSKPLLNLDTQAEALSRFSMGLLAEAGGDSAEALQNLEAAIQLDPHATILYQAAITIALKQDQHERALRLARQLRKAQPEALESLLLLAQVCALADQLAEAEDLFNQAVAEFPKHPDPHLSLSRFFLSQNQLPKAILALATPFDPPRDEANRLYLLGTLTIESARKTSDDLQAKTMVLKGIDFLENSLALNPTDPHKWQQLGYVYLFAKQFPQALKAFERAREQMPADLMLARQVMDLCIQTQPFDQALELYETLPEQTGMDSEIWFQYLVEKMTPEHRPLLIEYLEERILEKAPPAFHYTWLSSLYLDKELYTQAETTIQKALATHPNDSRLRTVLGTLHIRQENYAKAYADFSHVRTVSPEGDWAQNPFFAYNFMLAAQKSDHLEEAATTLASTYTNNPVVLNQYMHSLLTGESPVSTQSAIDLLKLFHRLSPKAAEALYYLSLLQMTEENYEAALGNAQQFELLAQDQGSTNLLTGTFYYQYASIHERTGQFEKAEQLFFKAIQMGDPTTVADAQNYIAYMWAERGEKLDKGLVLIQKALTSDPNNAAFIDTLGWVYYMQGRYKEALEQLKTACELLQDDPSIWEHLGDTYLKLGNRDEASKHWKKAIELAPDESRLKDRLEEKGLNPVDPPAEESVPEDTPLHP